MSPAVIVVLIIVVVALAGLGLVVVLGDGIGRLTQPSGHFDNDPGRLVRAAAYLRRVQR